MIGRFPTAIAQASRELEVSIRFRFQRLRKAAVANSSTSLRKYSRTASRVPSWITAEKAAPGSSQPSNSGTIRKWAVLLIGKNSVSPCTSPKIEASNQVIQPSLGFQVHRTPATAAALSWLVQPARLCAGAWECVAEGVPVDQSWRSLVGSAWDQ